MKAKKKNNGLNSIKDKNQSLWKSSFLRMYALFITGVIPRALKLQIKYKFLTFILSLVFLSLCQKTFCSGSFFFFFKSNCCFLVPNHVLCCRSQGQMLLHYWSETPAVLYAMNQSRPPAQERGPVITCLVKITDNKYNCNAAVIRISNSEIAVRNVMSWYMTISKHILNLCVFWIVQCAWV